MTSGIKCDSGIPDVWKYFKKDSVKPARRPEWGDLVSIKGDELVQFNKMDQESDEFKDLKEKLPWCNYLTCIIHKEKEIRVKELGEFEEKCVKDRAACAQDLLSVLAKKEPSEEPEPAYIIYKYKFTLTDGRPANKIIGFLWCPSGVKVKPKMLYASSKSELEKKLTGLKTMKQAEDEAEVVDTLEEFEKEK